MSVIYINKLKLGQITKQKHKIAKELKITPISDKLLEYKRNRIQHVNRMPRNWLPRVMKHYSPTGIRNHSSLLKRLLDTWDRNGSTFGPTPWQIYDDADDDNDDYYYYQFLQNTLWEWWQHLSNIQKSATQLRMTISRHRTGVLTDNVFRDSEDAVHGTSRHLTRHIKEPDIIWSNAHSIPNITQADRY